MRKRIAAMLLAICVIIIAASVVADVGDGEAAGPLPFFGGGTEDSGQEETPDPVPEPVPELPVPENPLTGLPMDPARVNLRPVAVMLNNVKKAQPQLGVSQADMIYEAPAEGGVTRMMAVYQSMDGVGNLGSIRSTRPYYLEIALGHDALLVHAGASFEAYRNIPAWGVDNMDGVRGSGDAAIFWRDADRRKTMGYEHSMLTSGANVQEYLDKGRYRTEHTEEYIWSQQYADEAAPVDGMTAERVDIKYSSYKTGVFQYDSNGGTYLVSQYGGPYADGNNGAQVRVKNLLILKTTSTVLDEEGRLQVQLTYGDGFFCCGGKCVPIHWGKAARNSPFVYLQEDGTPLALGRGNSYICITDQHCTVTIA